MTDTPARPAATEMALLPCPWCSNTSLTLEPFGTPRRPSFAVICEAIACGAMGPETTTRDEAIAAWNRRATPDLAALRAERDRLRGLVERLSDAAGGLSQGIRMINQDGPVMEVCVMVEAIRNEARAALAEGRADG